MKNFTLYMGMFCVFIISSLNIFSQEESAGGLGEICFDPSACNYNGDIILLQPGIGGGFDETCDYGDWYIPDLEAGVTGVVTQSCTPIEGYLIAEECCILGIIENDPFCINTTWDNVCQNAYDSCTSDFLGCNNPTACNYNPFAYCGSDIFCSFPQWYIPETPDASELEPNFPAVLACEAPDGYILGVQCCVLQEITSDSFCIETTWDGFCQGSYEVCIGTETPNAGCTDPSFCNYDPLACVDNGFCFGLAGCTDNLACNYNSDATCADGSCTYPGCTDPEASNYEPLSICGGSFYCIYCDSCPGDLNGDNAVTSADLTAFLAVFGQSCAPLWPPIDID